MTASTIRSAIDGTIDDIPVDTRLNSLQDSIAAEWRKSGRADLVHALRAHPTLLREKSQLLNLAIEEYKTNSRTSPDSDLESHCHRFREFGSSVERSIFRQLEAQRYIDCHPELLDLFSTPEWPRVGDQLGEFQVIEELGIGAAAHVYLCLQADVGFRHVVVKASPYSSFEASILGRLDHPNIVQIYSTGAVDGTNLNFICMPFRGRSTLSDLLNIAFRDDGCPRDDSCIAEAAIQWLGKGELSAEQPRHRWWNAFRRQTYVDGVLKIAIQIADALRAAHEAEILHGDLKPSNVLLTPDGRPLLLDFNLSQDFVNSPSVCGGTLPYMPPEYLRVLARNSKFERDEKFSASPDVYSFGALLYELLTGSPPVDVPDKASDSSAAADRILAGLENGGPKIGERNPFVSRKLEAIVLRCLAFDAKNRPAAMPQIIRELKSELNSFAALSRTARLRPLVFASVVGLPLTVAAGAGTYLAVQPDRYIVNYEQGMRLAATGRFDEAIDRFDASVQSNPSFAPAQFQLGRAHVAIGDFDHAKEDFNQLARNSNDVHSMAYVGYCFNRLSAPPAAIEWYAMAIKNGARAASVYNNLGVSYIQARPFLPRAEQLRLAENYLNEALKLDPTSAIVKRNIVRCATVAFNDEKVEDNPWRVWNSAWTLLKSSSDEEPVRKELLEWYRAVSSHKRGADSTLSTSIYEKAAREAFIELLRAAKLADGKAMEVDPISPKIVANSQSIAADDYFLEPEFINVAR